MSRAMKDSGVAWIGEIPEGWKTVRFKFLHNGMNTGEGIDKEYWSTDDQDTLFYTAGLEPIRTNYGDFPKWKYTKATDLLLARNGTPYVYLPDEGACYTDHIIRASLKENTIREFIRYSLQQSIASVVVDSVSLATWSASLWDEQEIAWPPLPEQSRIAAFLDRRCAEIDRVITATQRTMEEYRKLKQSIITEAVTHGVRGERKMKDSGVEWIGEIPEEWETTRIRYVGQVKTGPFGTQLSADEYADEGIPIINVKNIGSGYIRTEDLDKIPDSVAERLGEHKLKQNDIVFARKGSIDKHAIVGSESSGWVQGSDCIRLRLIADVLPLFLNYYLESTIIKDYLWTASNGATMASLNSGMIENIYIVQPSSSEQCEIVSYLDERCSEIDRLVEAKQQLLTQLEAYKKSVIYEYVTGKREVAGT